MIEISHQRPSKKCSSVWRAPLSQHLLLRKESKLPRILPATRKFVQKNKNYRNHSALMENSANNSYFLPSAESCYVPSSTWVPNAEQLSQMSLSELGNNGGKGFSIGAHVPKQTQVELAKASSCILSEESVGVSLAIPFQMRENAMNSLSQYYEPVCAGLSNPVDLPQQVFMQNALSASDSLHKIEHLAMNTSLSLDASCPPEGKHGVTHSLAATLSSSGIPVNGNMTGINDRSKVGGKVSVSDSLSGTSSLSCCECNEAIGYNAPGTELSLAIASVVDNGSDSTEDSHPYVSSFNNPPQNGNVDKPVSRKDEMFLRLVQQVRELEVQLQDRRTWAHQKALQAACKFSKDMSELKSLRLEHEEILCLKRDTQALEDNTMKRLTEMESALRKAGAQVDKANASVRKLETENAELRAEMEAAKLSAAESNAKCQEVAKREKKSSKKIQAWEKQKGKMVDEIVKQKQQIIQAQEQLASIKIQQHELEVRWREEEKAKEDALSLADAEKWAREQLELVAKRKEETWRRKSDADFQRHKDDIQRLESELEQLKIAAAEVCSLEPNSGISLHTADANGLQFLKDTSSQLMQELAELQDSRDICRDRECVMCMSEESSVVFLPCAHQIVCINCNDLHQKQGMRDCPSCRTVIQQRIQVLSASNM